MVRAVWQSFWGELNTPNNYYDDPQSAFVNQIGHMFGGLVAVAILCFASDLIFGEMPSRIGLLLFVPFVYIVAIELLVQGWSKADSWVDTGFVALGAAIPVAGLKEIAIHPRVELGLRPIEGLAVLVLCAVALAAYVWPRQRRKKWNSKP